MTHRYSASEALLEKALQTIPLGSQTFSKSKTQFPLGASPFFLQRGKGSHVWDVDGNEYIDFASSLAAITLGYGDPDVDAAVRKQLEDGVILSMPHPIESLVAEKIVEMVPCAEKVRFGKNGSDVTAAAVRLARAFTGRDHIAVCGYHGWQDWYIGSTARNLGVPQAVRDLTHAFAYNDVSSLKKLFDSFPGAIAGVILEPCGFSLPKDGFLEAVKELTAKNGAVLIFDEIVTGFRLANGGAQEYFKVTPDLATFGKGLANGYPVSAIAGRADIMRLMEEIFFSCTFGGEMLSLAAAHATLTKLQKNPILKTTWSRGEKLHAGIKNLIEANQLQDILGFGGVPVWSFLQFKDFAPYTQWQYKTLYLQEILERGIFGFGSHNLSYSHSEKDIQKTLDVYQEVFSLMKESSKKQDLEKRLRCKPIEPLFKIR